MRDKVRHTLLWWGAQYICLQVQQVWKYCYCSIRVRRECFLFSAVSVWSDHNGVAERDFEAIPWWEKHSCCHQITILSGTCCELLSLFHTLKVGLEDIRLSMSKLWKILKDAFSQCFQQWQDWWTKCACACARVLL